MAARPVPPRVLAQGGRGDAGHRAHGRGRRRAAALVTEVALARRAGPARRVVRRTRCWWLWRHRHGRREPRSTHRPGAAAGHGRATAAGVGRLAGVLTALAVLLVWFALVAPDDLDRLTPAAFVRIPLEGLVLVAARARAARAGPDASVALRPAAVLGRADHPEGPRHGLLRGARPAVQPGDRLELLRLGRGRAQRLDRPPRRRSLVVVAAVVLVARRAGPDAAGGPAADPRRRPAPAARRPARSPCVGVVWAVCAALGVQVAQRRAARLDERGRPRLRPGEPGAHGPARPAAVRAGGRRRPRSATPPPSDLLTGLRGKDVIVAFVESYGRVAVQGSTFSPQVDRVLQAGTAQLQRGRLRLPQRLPDLADVRRHQLAGALDPAVRAVDRQPAALRPARGRATASRSATRSSGPAGAPSSTSRPTRGPGRRRRRSTTTTSVYDARNVGYRGPKFSYAAMPDQYTLSAFQRLELGPGHRAR